jgi:hypothetical protein
MSAPARGHSFPPGAKIGGPKSILRPQHPSNIHREGWTSRRSATTDKVVTSARRLALGQAEALGSWLFADRTWGKYTLIFDFEREF